MSNASTMSQWMEKLMPAANKFANLRIIKVITRGFWFAMPMIFTGVIFQIISNIAAFALRTSNPDLLAKFTVLGNMAYGLMGLFFVIGIAIADAKSHKLDIAAPVTFALVMFFMLIEPEFQPTDSPFVTNFVVDWNQFGAVNMLLAIIAGLLSAEVCALFERKGWGLKVSGLPQFMEGWFKNMFAGIVLIGGTWILVYLLGININELIASILSPLIALGDTLPGLMVVSALGAFMFTIGIHPLAILTVFMPILMTGSAENAALYQAGVAPTLANGYHFTTFGTYLIFINVGGGGATLGLNFLMLFSKVKPIKELGKMAIVPSLLNINEPLIFGCPVVFNPPLALGAILIQGVLNPIIAYIVLHSGIMPVPSSMMMVPFLPKPILALLLNTGLIGAAIALLVWVVDTAAWYPFFKFWEKEEKLTLEQEAEAMVAA